MPRSLALLFVLSLLGLPLLGCIRRPSPQADADASSAGDAGTSTPSSSATADGGVQSGLALYTSLCSVCHGVDATGYKADNAPSLVNPTFLESATDEQLRKSIVEGRPGSSMAAYGKQRGGPLGNEDVFKIVGWLREHGTQTQPLPRRDVGDASLGDAARGGPLYAANCERCHGKPGTRGTAVHLANPRFLEAASDSFIDWAIRYGRPGTPMESWQKKLTDAQISDIVAHVRTFQIANLPGLLPAPTGHEPIVINPRGKNPTFAPRSTPCPPSVPCTPDERFVSIDQVKQALDAKQKIVIIDARPPSDWMRVHIPGAVSIPYHDLKRLDEVPNDETWVLAYCACPHHLSGDVVDALRKRGYKHAAILDEGILEWHRRGYPVVTAPGVERPPVPAPPPSAKPRPSAP